VGEGWGEALRDLLKDGLDIFHHLIIPKTQQPIAAAGQKLRPNLICLKLYFMLTTIQFHDEAVLLTAKIHDEPANWMLPAELGTTQLSGAQSFPQSALGLSLVTAQTTGTIPRCECF
jgi:hypothetical protein